MIYLYLRSLLKKNFTNLKWKQKLFWRTNCMIVIGLILLGVIIYTCYTFTKDELKYTEENMPKVFITN